MNPTNNNPDQTAPTTQTPEEVKNMAFRKKKVSADEVRRAWDSLSEADKNVLLISAREGYRSRVGHDESIAASFRRLH